MWEDATESQGKREQGALLVLLVLGRSWAGPSVGSVRREATRCGTWGGCLTEMQNHRNPRFLWSFPSLGRKGAGTQGYLREGSGVFILHKENSHFMPFVSPHSWKYLFFFFFLGGGRCGSTLLYLPHRPHRALLPSETGPWNPNFPRTSEKPSP